MADAPLTETLSLLEFTRLYDQNGPFELIDREVIPVSPNVMGHNSIAKKILATVH